MKIESYEFGRIIIDGKTYTSDVLVFPDRVRDKWWRKEGHRLDVDDLEEILKFQPAVLIVGTGYSGCMEIPDSTKRYLEMKGIRLIEAKTGEAVKLYNSLSEKEKVAAALHLTC
ncbi:MAG: Mth938-like domain-containing protein [Candidatus Hadarchaeales archaeon]